MAREKKIKEPKPPKIKLPKIKINKEKKKILDYIESVLSSYTELYNLITLHIPSEEYDLFLQDKTNKLVLFHSDILDTQELKYIFAESCERLYRDLYKENITTRYIYSEYWVDSYSSFGMVYIYYNPRCKIEQDRFVYEELLTL